MGLIHITHCLCMVGICLFSLLYSSASQPGVVCPFRDIWQDQETFFGCHSGDVGKIAANALQM